MRVKEAGLYKGNSTEDERTLRSKRWTSKNTPCVLTTLIILSQPVRLGEFPMGKLNHHSLGSTTQRSRTHEMEGQLKRAKLGSTGLFK